MIIGFSLKVGLEPCPGTLFMLVAAFVLSRPVAKSSTKSLLRPVAKVVVEPFPKTSFRPVAEFVLPRPVTKLAAF